MERRGAGGRRWWLALEVEEASWPEIRRGMTLGELRALPEREVLCVLDLGAARGWRRVRAPWQYRSEAERLQNERDREGLGETAAERRRRLERARAAAGRQARQWREAARLEVEREALAWALAPRRAARVAGEGAEAAAVLAGLRRALGRHAGKGQEGQAAEARQAAEDSRTE